MRIEPAPGGLERTFCLIKPDAVTRRLTGTILARFEAAGLTLVAARLVRLTQDQAERIYESHRGEPHHVEIAAYIASGPGLAAVLEGPDAIETVKAICGHTDFRQAAPGTIRRTHGLTYRWNAIHRSASAEEATAEIAIVFEPGDLHEPVPLEKMPR